MTENRKEYQTYSDDVKKAAEVIWHLGHDFDIISDLLAVNISTLRTWRDRYNWGKQEPKKRAEEMAVKRYPESKVCQFAYMSGYEQGQEDLN